MSFYYDDHFSTQIVNSNPESDDIPNKEWIDLFKFAREKHFDDADLPLNNPSRLPSEPPPPLAQGPYIPETGDSPPRSADTDSPSQESGE